ETQDYPLGPALGQCCGGDVKIFFLLFLQTEAAALGAAGCFGGKACLVVRPIEGGGAVGGLRHRKNGDSGPPLQAVRVTREMLSGTRPLSTVFLPASKRGTAWFIEPAGRRTIPLFLYGAGHVGRALITALSDLPFDVTWIDTSENRFPPGTSKSA